MRYPIFSSSDGRTVIGYASGTRSATVAIRAMVSVPKGFTLNVWRRSQFNMELLGDMSDGFCYSIYKSY